jgi:hypothetical protein
LISPARAASPGPLLMMFRPLHLRWGAEKGEYVSPPNDFADAAKMIAAFRMLSWLHTHARMPRAASSEEISTLHQTGSEWGSSLPLSDSQQTKQKLRVVALLHQIFFAVGGVPSKKCGNQLGGWEDGLEQGTWKMAQTISSVFLLHHATDDERDW